MRVDPWRVRGDPWWVKRDPLRVRGDPWRVRDRETQHALRRIAHPVLVSAVDEDDLLSLGVPFSLHRALPQSTLAILPGTRHTFRAVDPALYARLLMQHFGT